MFLCGFSFFLSAQTRVDKYCEVMVVLKNRQKRKAILDLGETDSLFAFRDSSVIIALQKVNTLKTSTDVSNYMSQLGWTLTTVIPFEEFSVGERLYFKKTFDSWQLANVRR